MIAIPSLLAGRFRIEGQVGRGACWAVSRARDLETGGPCIVKVVDPDAPAGVRRRLEREGDRLVALNHPNVQHVHAWGQTAGLAWLAMEPAEGGTVGEWVVRNGVMPGRLAVDVVRQACRAVAAAHALGLVHGDLAPANIRVSEDDVCKVADFGLAGTTPEDSAGVTMPGVRGFTAPSLAPAALAAATPSGTAIPDARADVYALGAILFTLLTDRVVPDLTVLASTPSLLAGLPGPLRPIVIAATAALPAVRPTADALEKRLAQAAEELVALPPHTPRLADTSGKRGAENQFKYDTVSSSQKTVLVVEDDAALRRIAQVVLGNLGWNVLVAEDGRQALRTADSHGGPIDVVLTDLVLPGEHGALVGDAVRRVRSGVRVVYMSAYSLERLAARGIKLEQNPFLHKPFTPDELVQILQG